MNQDFQGWTTDAVPILISERVVDLLRTQRFGFVFVVEAVKKALERAKVRNLRFTPLDQVESSGPI